MQCILAPQVISAHGSTGGSSHVLSAPRTNPSSHKHSPSMQYILAPQVISAHGSTGGSSHVLSAPRTNPSSHKHSPSMQCILAPQVISAHGSTGGSSHVLSAPRTNPSSHKHSPSMQCILAPQVISAHGVHRRRFALSLFPLPSITSIIRDISNFSSEYFSILAGRNSENTGWFCLQASRQGNCQHHRYIEKSVNKSTRTMHVAYHLLLLLVSRGCPKTLSKIRTTPYQRREWKYAIPFPV